MMSPNSLLRIHRIHRKYRMSGKYIKSLQLGFNDDDLPFNYIFVLVGYVEERPWWPIQSPNTEGRKKKAKG